MAIGSQLRGRYKALTYPSLLALIITGCLLVPMAGMAILLALPDATRQYPVPDMRRRSRHIVLWGLLGLALLHGTHWLLWSIEVGYSTVLTWGWVAMVVVAGLSLAPAAVTAIAVRNRPGPTPLVVLGVVLGLSLVQASYWLIFGLWAWVDLLTTLAG